MVVPALDSPATEENSWQRFNATLLHLADRMRTKTGSLLARARHKLMVQLAEEFKKEWNTESIE